MADEFDRAQGEVWSGIVAELQAGSEDNEAMPEIDFRPRLFLLQGKAELKTGADLLRTVIYNKTRGLLTESEFDIVTDAFQVAIENGCVPELLNDMFSYEQIGNDTIAVFTVPGGEINE